MRSALLVLLLAACGGDDSQAPGDDGIAASIRYDVEIPGDAEFVSGRILVGFAGSEGPEELLAPRALGDRPLRRLRKWESLRAGMYELPAGVEVREAVEALRASGDFLYVEPDYIRHATSVDDPYRTYQWNFDAVNAESAWAYSTGSGVIVAVIDTGVSTAGPYDGLGTVGTGYDFVNNDSNPTDDEGHGTHVSGTIAAATNNTAGVAGLAYDATIMPVKVLDSSGAGTSADVVSGINYAVANGASVINMSLGSTAYSSTEAAAVASAYSAGVFVACASGNSGASSVEYPAAYSGSVAVGATDYNDTRVSYSTYGSALDLMAPGGDVYADDNGDGYADGILQETFESGTWGFYFWEGTSMATPHVAAAAALLMANGATNVEAETYLKDTATDLGSSGFDTRNGYGFIQPDAALAAWEADNADTGGTGTPPCSTTAVTADYTASQGELLVAATATSSSETLTVVADDNDLGSLSWNVSTSQFEATFTWPVAPEELTVSSDCGDSDVLSATVY